VLPLLRSIKIVYFLINRRHTLLISECNRRFYVSEQVETLFLPEMFGADERGTPIVLG